MSLAIWGTERVTDTLFQPQIISGIVRCVQVRDKFGASRAYWHGCDLELHLTPPNNVVVAPPVSRGVLKVAYNVSKINMNK